MTRFGEARWARLVVIALLTIYVIPIYWLVATSLKTTPQIAANPASFVFEPTVDAYSEIARAGAVPATSNSIILACAVTVLVMLLAVPAAYGLARGGQHLATAALVALIVLQMVPPSTSIIPLFKVLAGWGLLGTMPGLVLADASLVLPLAILLLRPFVLGIPLALEEAAAVDGAGMGRTFLTIVVPLMRNGIITVSALTFIIVWGEFLYAVTILASPADYPLSAMISQQVGQFQAFWPRLMALAVVGTVPILIIFLSVRRQLLQGLSLGGVK